MLEYDRINLLVQSRADFLNEVLGKARSLSGKIAIEATVKSENELLADHCQELAALNYQLRGGPELKMYYGGEGLMSGSMDDSSPKTLYASIEHARGRLKRFVMLNPYDLEMTCAKSDDHPEQDNDGVTTFGDSLIYDYGDEDEDDQNGIDQDFINSESGCVISRLAQPTNSNRLFAEFLVETNNMPNQYVGGICNRSDEVRRYHLIDMEKISIDYVELPNLINEPKIPNEKIAQFISSQSNAFRKLVNSRPFLSKKANEQLVIVEEIIAETNNYLDFSNKTFEFSTQVAYLIVEALDDDGQTFKTIGKLDLADNSNCQLGKLIRLDSLECFRLSQGQKISSFPASKFRKDGLCLVVEISPVTIDDQVHTVVWLPVSSQKLEGTFYDDAEFF